MNTNIHIPCVVGATPINAILLSTFGPVGVVSFNFLNVIPPAGGVCKECTVRIYESDDKKTFTAIGSNIVLKPGGEHSVSVRVRKPYIMMRGCAESVGGSVRLDIFQRGVPFRGQISVDLFGKRGLGREYVGNTVQDTLDDEPAPASWPE